MASSPCFFRSWHSSALSDFACISLSVIRTTGRMPFVRACCILKNCKSLFLVGSLSRRQMPGFTLGGLAVVQLAGLSCLSSRSLRFLSLSLQRNILSTSLASFSFSRLSPTISSDSYSFTSCERKSSSSPLRVEFCSDSSLLLFNTES